MANSDLFVERSATGAYMLHQGNVRRRISHAQALQLCASLLSVIPGIPDGAHHAWEIRHKPWFRTYKHYEIAGDEVRATQSRYVEIVCGDKIIAKRVYLGIENLNEILSEYGVRSAVTGDSNPYTIGSVIAQRAAEFELLRRQTKQACRDLNQDFDKMWPLVESNFRRTNPLVSP